jgi:hypothetical protein
LFPKDIQKKDIKHILGGQAFICRCGFVGGYTTGDITITAPTLTDALQVLAGLCQGAGATCNGCDYY